MPFTITKPGIYTGVPTADYFADPAPAPSLTQSVAKILLEKSPLHAWCAHPRLNPDYRRDDDTKFDVGNIAHALLIGRGKELVVLDAFDDWRTKEAKVRREEATAEGKHAVLGKHFALADRMVRAAREQLDLRGLGALFTEGEGEVVTAWNERGIWFRQMLDWLTPDHRIVADYKTTGESAAPHALARKLAADGWHIQAAMAERGLDALEPADAGRRRFLFIVQEDEKPYALNVVEVRGGPMTMGRKMLGVAAGVWRQCVETNRFPGYALDIAVPEFPGWAEAQWLDREMGEFSNVLMAG
jgi:hypothetical protein